MLLQIENGVGLSLSSGELVTIAGPHVFFLNPQISLTPKPQPLRSRLCPFNPPFLFRKNHCDLNLTEPLLLVSTG